MRRLCLVAALCCLGCGDSPTAPAAPFDPLAPSEADLAIQERLADHILFLYEESTTVKWLLTAGHYRFEQTVDGDVVAWEEGHWWVRADDLWFDRQRGERTTQLGTIAVSAPYRRSIGFELLAASLYDDSLLVEMAGTFTYQVTELANLERVERREL